ncbi:DUF1403 family protein [Paracoccus beibuensis]|uniref:DUF1403 family protein n=1 Tax=Paracoccus beibuensis TaxID=547602 RepID=UPI00223FCD14|nr:DUF1403 family protein [Paracoccus beibuensis]
MADAGPWLAAQARHVHMLAEAAREVGRLEASLNALSLPEAEGARQRLALVEVEAMLWAQGLVLKREEIGRDLLNARAGSDPEAMRLARWAVRRLEGQGSLTNLPAFLGLHHREASGPPSSNIALRLQGHAFDAAAGAFISAVEGWKELHPLARGPALLAVWRMAELSPAGNVVEPAVWSARHMAVGAEALHFVPLGQPGRRIWTGHGPAEDRLAAHLAALSAGAQEARAVIMRVSDWAGRAMAATAWIKGDNAAKVVEALTARPLLSAMEAETMAGISRPTAERMLNRLTDLGLVREVTGHRRFRLWTISA